MIWHRSMRALVNLNSQTVAVDIETNVQNDIKYIFWRAKRINDVYVKFKDLLRRTFRNLLDIYSIRRLSLDNAGFGFRVCCRNIFVVYSWSDKHMTSCKNVLMLKHYKLGVVNMNMFVSHMDKYNYTKN